MANYMEEVAKLIGVELGEKFKVGTLGLDYVLTNEGLFYVLDNSRRDNILCGILEGKVAYSIKPWKPKDDEIFYVVISNGEVMYKYWDDCASYKNYYKLGNCYRTKEEAETNRDKWLAFYASDEVLEV